MVNFILQISMWALFLVVGVLVGMEYQRMYSLEATYNQYNHVRIYEDGSYEGQLVGGNKVKGCLEGALCDE